MCHIYVYIYYHFCSCSNIAQLALEFIDDKQMSSDSSNHLEEPGQSHGDIDEDSEDEDADEDADSGIYFYDCANHLLNYLQLRLYFLSPYCRRVLFWHCKLW